MKATRRILNGIETASKIQGYIMAVVLITLVFLVVFEVTMRYVFNSPTIWGTELQLFMYAGLFMLSQAYTLFRGAHARVDVIVQKFSVRTQNIIELICYFVFFVPFACIILKCGIDFAIDSWSKLETSVWSGWAPPLYPVKTIIPIGAFMLLLQALTETVRKILNIAGIEE